MLGITNAELDALREGVTEVKLPETSLAEMNKLAEEISELRDKEKELSDLKKDVTMKLEAKEQRVTELLLENGITSYKAPAGAMGLSFRTSVRQPQGEEQAKFYAYLKSRGEFDTMISVNSMKLNAYFKEQLELAKERGDSDFQIPGLTEVKINPTLSFRRTR